jgi:hypothetical protein
MGTQSILVPAYFISPRVFGKLICLLVLRKSFIEKAVFDSREWEFVDFGLEGTK